ncbi:MAG TPA: hypothetical protein PK228_06095 [Saprospiraceae bacterium]|nr:hypothetical protein [Saprospiraceae bacterium]
MLPLQAKYLARYAEATVAVSRDGARKHAEEARSLANRAHWDYAKGIALRALGQSVSNGKEAADHLRDAESIFRCVGARTELERTLTLL